MSVTDNPRTGMGAVSRNKALIAEWEAEDEREAAERESNPEKWAGLDRLIAAFGGEATPEERETWADRAWHASYWCSFCHKTVFEMGDVVHRRRRSRGGSWSLEAYCEACVREWHPSWLASRPEPIPCAGGCGVLVTDWYGWRPTILTCSKRCQERAAEEQRRVERPQRACDVCGNEFVPSRSDARFCKPACRQKAYRERRA